MKKNIFLGLILTSLIFCCSMTLNKVNKIDHKNESKTELAIYIEETPSDQIPSKESGYYYNREKSNCNEGAKMKWDSISWSPVIENVTETRTKCNLYFTTTYTEGILNGADPSLKQELVPVTIEGNGTVRKADLTKKWYSYEEKRWANAVITQNSYDGLDREGKVKGATKKEGYVTFDGVDDYINLGLENYEFGTNVSFAVQMQMISHSETKANDIIGNWEGGGCGLNVYQGKYNMNCRVGIEQSQNVISSNTPVVPLEWVTLVGTYDGNVGKLYVNGNLEGQLEFHGNVSPVNLSMMLGASPTKANNGSYFSNVNIKKAVIFDRALSEKEIKENMSKEIRIMDNAELLSYVDFTERNYEANEIIPESNIESYFVWIPRYKYQIFNEGTYNGLTTVENKVQTIQVVFENKDTPVSNGSTVGSWLTHPAFTAFNSNGMWVGKFETGKKSGSDNVRNGEQVQIKPNVSSWRNIQVGNAFYTTYDYKRELDSHMMKNMEWGAVAYLQHSAYGSQASVRINNNSSYVTGYSANNEPTCIYTGTNESCNVYCNNESCNKPYNNSTGYLASTTGNISGIYDMSGGAWEYVMGVLLDTSGKPISGRNSSNHSGFKGNYGEGGSNTTGYDFPNPKYYDTYSYSTSNQEFNRRILGDSTGEVGPFKTLSYLTQSVSVGSWYSDSAYFINSNNPWFVRGYQYNAGLAAGINAFNNSYGHVNSYVSFRVVLTP